MDYNLLINGVYEIITHFLTIYQTPGTSKYSTRNTGVGVDEFPFGAPRLFSGGELLVPGRALEIGSEYGFHQEKISWDAKTKQQSPVGLLNVRLRENPCTYLNLHLPTIASWVGGSHTNLYLIIFDFEHLLTKL